MFPRRLILSLAASWLVLGCSSKDDDNCPGLCPDESVPPTMTIATADGAASIASAKVVSGPCKHVLTHSAGEVGVPTGYGVVQVFYAPELAALGQSGGNPPLCTITLTSLWGDVQSIGVEVKATADEKPCCPYGTCCPKIQDAAARRYHVEFARATQTVSFQPGVDGGSGDAADAPQNPIDSQTIDAAPEDTEEEDARNIDVFAIAAEGPDGAGLDSAGIDLPEIDAAGGQ
jgi:hypothetical protein